MKCKYVTINGFLIKNIVDGKYRRMSFTKTSFNRYTWKNGQDILGVNIPKKEVRFIKELCYQLSFINIFAKENKDE